MKNLKRFLQLIFCFLAAISFGQDAPDTTTAIPTPFVAADTIFVADYAVQHQGASLQIQAQEVNGIGLIGINGVTLPLFFKEGLATTTVEVDERGGLYFIKPQGGKAKLYHISKKKDEGSRVRNIPLWLSIVPPAIAILLALIFKEVIFSLFIGIWAGAWIAGGMRLDSIYYIFTSFLEVVQKYVINALNDSGHLAVIVFSLLIGGMVAVISKNGGMAGVVEKLSRFATTPQRAQFITWFLGVVIFFDDYANTLIVGNTMRSVTDKFKVSREKLAYIVDSTAAPVASIALITTWIGAELGYIDSGLKILKGLEKDLTPYAVFLSSLKYSFYPVFTLIFILILIYLKKDFGPMYKSEKRARTTGRLIRRENILEEEGGLENLAPVKGAPHNWYNAVIPVVLVIVLTIIGLFDTGMEATRNELLANGIDLPNGDWSTTWTAMNQLLTGEEPSAFRKLGKLIGNADSYVALLWASATGAAAAILLTLFGKIMRIGAAMYSLSTGFKTMVPALIILTLAWSLATTTEELHTAEYLSGMLENKLNPLLLPVIVFVLAALISFSTGSSWSTMAILYPIVIPTTWAVSLVAGLGHDHSLELLFNVISVTLAASVLGDHCSPISDTTILSSLASDCNHLDHVRTQMPYALTVGAVSIVCGGLSTAWGGSWGFSFLLLLIGVSILFFIVYRFGKRIN